MVLLNRYYQITKFYSFLKNTAFKGGAAVIIFVLLLVVLELFVLDFNSLLNHLVATYSATFIFSFFLASETILGIIPPEVFIAWSSKSASPWLFLFILATISYAGGIISYFIGNRLFLIPNIKNHIENKLNLKLKIPYPISKILNKEKIFTDVSSFNEFKNLVLKFRENEIS